MSMPYLFHTTFIQFETRQNSHVAIDNDFMGTA